MANEKNQPIYIKPPTNDEERKDALKQALTLIEKKHGKGTVMKYGDRPIDRPPVISTGCIDLDFALGIGGVPRGRIVEIFGPESSGKTTIALQIVAEAQKAGGTAAFIDAEHALDPTYARKLGVDVNELLISQPDFGEQALEVADELARSFAVDIIVIDSVAALVPRAELEGDMGELQVGAQARLMSKALRKLAGTVSKTNCTMIFINQLREKIGVMYGNPETTTGGRALKFFASVRIDVRKGEVIKNGSEMIGSRTKIKVVKNKMAPPFKFCEVDMIYGEGISREGSLIDLAVENGIIKRSGSWYNYGDMRIAQGRENVRLYLRDNPEVYAEVDQKLREIVYSGGFEMPTAPDDDTTSDRGEE